MAQWPAFVLRWNAVSFRRPGAATNIDVTVTEEEAISATEDAVAALAVLVRQLLGSAQNVLTPLPALRGEANAVLQRALAPGGGKSAFRTAQEFWNELRRSSGVAPVAAGGGEELASGATVREIPRVRLEERRAGGDRRASGAGGRRATDREPEEPIPKHGFSPMLWMVIAAVALASVAGGVWWIGSRTASAPPRPAPAETSSRLAAEQGDARAQFTLGGMLERGQGVVKDEKEAVSWYRKAAEQGEADAQKALGVMLSEGRGVVKDEKEAVSWFRKAAEQGEVDAQTNLGFMLGEGRGVVKDEKEAVSWYRKAAEKGEVVAQFNLGAMLAGGRGVEKDEKEAAIWYRKAAEQGNAYAQNNLASRLEDGRGVAKDEKEAVIWYRKAAEQGNADAQAALRRISERP